MTALGNVMALVRELQDERDSVAASSPAAAGAGWGVECTAATACASSLGAVLGCIRELQGDGGHERVAARPASPARRRVALAA